MHQTLEQELAKSIAPRRFDMGLLAAFAGTAPLLALVGIYGIVAYSMAQCTSEIGISMALGAQRAEILWMMLRQTMSKVFLGILAGAVAALGLTRLMTAMIYEVRPSDPGIFLATAVFLGAAALLACLAPALKAVRVDPAVALRHE